MGDLPIQMFIPFVMIPLVGFMYWRGMKMRQQHIRENPQYTLGVLSQRWQLQLLEGDPAYNLFISEHDNDVARATPSFAGMTGNTVARTGRMQGEHRGHPVRFEFYDQTKIDRGVVETTYARAYTCALSVGVNAAFPPFEIVLRNENQYFRVERRLAGPAQSFGQHALDATLVLSSPDARIGAVLAPVIGPLIAMQYVHVLGGNGTVQFVMAPLSTSSGLYYAESLLQVLLAVADVLEGRTPVLPNALPPAPLPGR